MSQIYSLHETNLQLQDEILSSSRISLLSLAHVLDVKLDRVPQLRGVEQLVIAIGPARLLLRVRINLRI